jgi:pimeloyl-ACP methyl ester carboxylesterase
MTNSRVERTRSATKAEAALAKYVDLARFEDGESHVNACFDGARTRLRIHFKYSRGAEGAMQLVLVHGLGLSYRYMMPTAQALIDDYAVYVPDLPGFGATTRAT